MFIIAKSEVLAIIRHHHARQQYVSSCQFLNVKYLLILALVYNLVFSPCYLLQFFMHFSHLKQSNVKKVVIIFFQVNCNSLYIVQRCLLPS